MLIFSLFLYFQGAMRVVAAAHPLASGYIVALYFDYIV